MIHNQEELGRNMGFTWHKPVIIFYRERTVEPERKAFLVVKAWRLEIRKNREQGKLDGNIAGFFPLMGDFDYLSSKEGAVDQYVLCWFDDEEDDFTKSWRRLTGVTFQDGISLNVNSMNKRIYYANFKAEKGKLK
jgi:hypothetical protein